MDRTNAHRLNRYNEDFTPCLYKNRGVCPIKSLMTSEPRVYSIAICRWSGGSRDDFVFGPRAPKLDDRLSVAWYISIALIFCCYIHLMFILYGFFWVCLGFLVFESREPENFHGCIDPLSPLLLYEESLILRRLGICEWGYASIWSFPMLHENGICQLFDPGLIVVLFPYSGFFLFFVCMRLKGEYETGGLSVLSTGTGMVPWYLYE